MCRFKNDLKLDFWEFVLKISNSNLKKTYSLVSYNK